MASRATLLDRHSLLYQLTCTATPPILRGLLVHETRPVTSLQIMPPLYYRFGKQYILELLRSVVTGVMPLFNAIPTSVAGGRSIVNVDLGYRLKPSVTIGEILRVLVPLFELLEVHSQSFDLTSPSDVKVLLKMFWPFLAVPNRWLIPTPVVRALTSLFSPTASKTEFARSFADAVKQVITSSRIEPVLQFAGENVTVRGSTYYAALLKVAANTARFKGIEDSWTSKPLRDLNGYNLRHLVGLTEVLETMQPDLNGGIRLYKNPAALKAMIFALMCLPLAPELQDEYQRRFDQICTILEVFMEFIPLNADCTGIVLDYTLGVYSPGRRIPVLAPIGPLTGTSTEITCGGDVLCNPLTTPIYINVPGVLDLEADTQKPCGYGVNFPGDKKTEHPVQEFLSADGTPATYYITICDISFRVTPVAFWTAYADVVGLFSTRDLEQLGVKDPGVKTLVVFDPNFSELFPSTMGSTWCSVLLVIAIPIAKRWTVQTILQAFDQTPLNNVYLLCLQTEHDALVEEAQWVEAVELAFLRKELDCSAKVNWQNLAQSPVELDVQKTQVHVDDNWCLHCYSLKVKSQGEKINAGAEQDPCVPRPTKNPRLK